MKDLGRTDMGYFGSVADKINEAVFPGVPNLCVIANNVSKQMVESENVTVSPHGKISSIILTPAQHEETIALDAKNMRDLRRNRNTTVSCIPWTPPKP